MCPDALEAALKKLTAKGQKPKAILPVHLYGMPAMMPEIMAIAEKYEVPIVEDAAEALGSEINGKKCGTFGKLGILSFNGNKIITTSGGGALLSDDEALIQKARFLATQARDPAPHYEHSHIGYNYRMSNILAGIGRGQMQVLPERIKQRRANHNFYKEILAEVPGISFLPEPEGYFSNRWLITIKLDPKKTGGITREDIRLALEAQNIESRPLWKPMHLQPVFEKSPYFGGSLAQKLFDQGLCLPSGSNLTAQDKERIKHTLVNIFNIK
jgi:dTDP-4-amino-4,6-dideoxygalactose transaminase